MGRPRKVVVQDSAVSTNGEQRSIVDALASIPRAELPAMLALAKADGDLDTVEAILERCRNW
jgi:hypothetical protein